MKRRVFIFSGVSAAFVGALPAFGQSAQDQIVEQLQEQGYRRIRINRTLLGRTRILADGAGRRREIVINPSTGAILRDYMVITRDENEDDRTPRVFQENQRDDDDRSENNNDDNDNDDGDSHDGGGRDSGGEDDDDDGGDDNGGDDDNDGGDDDDDDDD